MFRIGDFSRLARVSCRLLRYYDEIGLLKPSATDSESGYRYYAAGQLGALNRILVLRDLGFTLDEIARMVADSAVALREMIGSFAEGRLLVAALLASVPGGVARGALGSLIGIAHSPKFEADQIDLEIGFVLNSELHKEIILPDGRILRQRELPAGRVAACVRVGSPEQAHLTTGKIAQFVAANHYRLAGPSREVFLQWPHLQRLDESIVEMQYPIA